MESRLVVGRSSLRKHAEDEKEGPGDGPDQDAHDEESDEVVEESSVHLRDRRKRYERASRAWANRAERFRSWYYGP